MESKWYGGEDSNDKPRLLTEKEVNSVLNRLPSVTCSDKHAREEANGSIRQTVAELLSDVYLAPSQINSFIDQVTAKFINARVREGESAGILTADALGENSTQIALNTFHQGGAATAALVGIEGLKSLIFAYQPKNKSTVIHLKKPPTSLDDALSIRRELEGLSILDYFNMKSLEIETWENLGRQPWHDLYEHYYGEINSSPDTIVLRVKLKMHKLFYTGKTLDKFREIIDYMSQDLSEIGTSIRVIFSPFRIGILELHVLDSDDTKKDDILIFRVMDFLRNIIIPMFQSTYIQGIPVINKLYPVSVAVWERSVSMIRKINESEFGLVSDKLGTSQYDQCWYVLLNKLQQEKHGIQLSEIASLLNSLGIVHYKLNERVFYCHNQFSNDNLAKFIRERKNGLPYIKDSNIFSNKVDKYISYAKIRIYQYGTDFYITFDQKYIKYVLHRMHKIGFKWSLSDSLTLYQGIEFNSQLRKMESIISENFKPGYRDIMAYKLINYPKWLNGDLNNDDLTVILESTKSYDLERVFFICTNLEVYIYIPDKYQEEVNFCLDKADLLITESRLASYQHQEHVNILKQETTNNLDYLAINAKYRTSIEKFLVDAGYTWGDPIPFRLTPDINYTMQYDFDDTTSPQTLTFHKLELPDRVRYDIENKIYSLPDGLELLLYYQGNDSSIDIPAEELVDLDNLIASTVTSFFREESSASNYEHWFYTSKDIVDKRYNLYDVLSHPLVEASLSYNNSLAEISNVLGVEAAYSYFIKALKDLNDKTSGNYVDPRHILIIADFIFSRGKPNGVLFAGLSRQPLGHITLITVERAMEVLRKLAFGSNKEDINSVSIAISTGQTISYGTGMFNFSNDPKTQQKIVDVLSEAYEGQMDSDQVHKAVKRMEHSSLYPFEVPKSLPSEPVKKYKDYLEPGYPALVADIIKENPNNPEIERLLNSRNLRHEESVIIPQQIAVNKKAPDFVVDLLSQPLFSFPSMVTQPSIKKSRLQTNLLKRKVKQVTPAETTEPVAPVAPVAPVRQKVASIDVEEFLANK